MVILQYTFQRSKKKGLKKWDSYGKTVKMDRQIP